MANNFKAHKETWRDIFGYDGKYQVSNHGRVRNAQRNNRILTNEITRAGYHKVSLVGLDGKTIKHYFVHRLVALCFIPIYSFERNQINHIDGNRWNNVAWNLEWCNNSENQLHSNRVLKTGALYGLDNNQAKLSDTQIKEIKAKYNTGEYTQSQLAKEYGVTQANISMIITNKSRKYD